MSVRIDGNVLEIRISEGRVNKPEQISVRLQRISSGNSIRAWRFFLPHFDSYSHFSYDVNNMAKRYQITRADARDAKTVAEAYFSNL